MEKKTCASCITAKATLECGLCHDPVCKKCAQFVEEDTFSFLTQVPAELKHSIYCPGCYFSKVEPELTKYNELMEQAKNVSMFYKDQGKETRRMSRKEDTLTVKDCTDRNETIMRLAFLAAEMNFNSLIDVDIQAVKVRDGAYQTTVFHGTGLPVNLSEAQLKRK